MGRRSTTTVVIGGGHSGLAMSRRLSERSIDHVVLERGTVAHSWRTERWDSLRLLTPNWQSRLPGFAYDGDDPDGFMTMPEVIGFITQYASAIGAPVQDGTTVTSVAQHDGGYVVDTDQGSWQARCVVLASGACNAASMPACAADAPPGVLNLSPLSYRNPAQLPDGGVLVVGASATGLQLADEIQRSGRQVTISVGEHVRMPRTYRGKDILWWMDATGLWDERYDTVDDVVRARHVPSPQLVGTPQRVSLDLNALRSIGVEVRGRLGMIRDGVALFSGGLRNQCALADLKMNRLLNSIDEWALANGHGPPAGDEERPAPTGVEDGPLMLDLRTGEIATILWATGFKPDYSWLNVPVLDYKGKLRHEGGVVESPGMYTLGSTFLRRRRSSFISGAAADSEDLANHLAAYLG